MVIDASDVPETITAMGTGVFYKCASATLYVEAATLPAGWNERYNPSFRAVIYGVKLSADKSYVTAITGTDKNVLYVTASGGLTAPQREGYEFMGWSETEGGAVKYALNDVVSAMNKTIYAVWKQKTE